MCNASYNRKQNEGKQKNLSKHILIEWWIQKWKWKNAAKHNCFALAYQIPIITFSQVLIWLPLADSYAQKVFSFNHNRKHQANSALNAKTLGVKKLMETPGISMGFENYCISLAVIWCSPFPLLKLNGEPGWSKMQLRIFAVAVGVLHGKDMCQISLAIFWEGGSWPQSWHFAKMNSKHKLTEG